MRTSKIALSLALVAAIGLGGVLLIPSFAADRSAESNDRQPWLSLAEILTRLEKAGYRNIEKIEREHGSYEARATDTNGQRVKLYINPHTGEVTDRRERGDRHENSYRGEGGKDGQPAGECNRRRCRDDLPAPAVGAPKAIR